VIIILHFTVHFLYEVVELARSAEKHEFN